jgi:hypothetical protein
VLAGYEAIFQERRGRPAYGFSSTLFRHPWPRRSPCIAWTKDKNANVLDERGSSRTLLSASSADPQFARALDPSILDALQHNSAEIGARDSEQVGAMASLNRAIEASKSALSADNSRALRKRSCGQVGGRRPGRRRSLRAEDFGANAADGLVVISSCSANGSPMLQSYRPVHNCSPFSGVTRRR